jgi:4-amino-4-deoxy-L-arabinose transferase-like glycosyltransferase
MVTAAGEGNRIWRWISWILLLGVALGLRVWGLGDDPNGFWTDEAANGYFSYCLLETGRGPSGEFLPLFSQSLGDNNESLYRFLTVPSLLLFGVTAFAVRLPAALVGTLTVWSLQRVVGVWFGRVAGWSAAWLLALSPWHLQFSRAGFRTILLPLLVCLGLQAFQKGIGDRPRRLLLSGLLFGLGLYSYSAGRVFVPILVGSLCLMFWRELWERRRYAIGFGVIFGAILIVLLPFWVSSSGLARAESVRVESLGQGVLNYLSYFDPAFLFLEGDDILRHSLRGFGQLHRLEILTLLLGLTAMATERWRPHWILLVWLLAYPLAAAVAVEPHHALRSLIGAPIFAIISGIGVGALYEQIGKLRVQKLLLSVFSLALFLSASLWVTAYFGSYRIYGAPAWKYGFEEALEIAGETSARCTVMSHELMAPHLFYLFYRQVDPEVYRASPRNEAPDIEIDTYDVGDLHVGPIEEALTTHPTCAFITAPGERPAETDGHTVNYPDGTFALEVFERQSP